MAELINNHVLLFAPPKYRLGIKHAREFANTVARGVTGGEDRQANAATAYRTLEYAVALTETEERAEFEAAIEEGLASGKVAVPLWGRAAVIATDTSSSTLILTDASRLAVGDVLFVLDDDGATPVHRVRTITAKSTNTLTLDNPLSHTFTAGALVWPLLFGRLLPVTGEAIKGEAAILKLKLKEPSGEGDLGDSSSCPAEVCIDAVDISYNVCDKLTITAALANTCPTTVKVSWRALAGASSYKVYRSDTENGTYAYIGTVTGTSYTVIQSLMGAGKWWKVTALWGTVESPLSNAVFVADITLEQVMRALQERAFMATGSYVTFPDCTYPAPASPGNYPADGFYDDDLVQIDIDNTDPAGTYAALLVGGLCDLIHDLGATLDFISMWVTTSAWEGLTALAYYDPATFPVPDSSAVDYTNYLDALTDIREGICLLNTLAVDCTMSGTLKEGGDDAGTLAGAVASALSLWAASSSAAVALPGAMEKLFQNYDTTYFSAEFTSTRGEMTYDLTNFPDGLQFLSWWVRIDSGEHPEADFVWDTEQWSFTFYSAFAPPAQGGGVIAPTGYFGRTSLAPVAATSWSTPTYGPDTMMRVISQNPVPAQYLYADWQIYDALVRVIKSELPDDAHWTYYP